MTADIDGAAAALKAGGLVILTTETVYGLAADAGDARAVAAVYAAKGRPAFNPLIAHVADLATAQRIATFDPRAGAPGKGVWRGPRPCCGRSAGRWWRLRPTAPAAPALRGSWTPSRRPARPPPPRSTAAT